MAFKEYRHISKYLASKEKSDGKFSKLNVLIGGAAGDGIMSAGQMFSRVAAKHGYYSMLYTEYPSLIRGGHNTVSIRLNSKPVRSQLSHIDVLFAINFETIELHIDDVVKGGVIIYDPSIMRRKKEEDFNRSDIIWRPIPLKEIVREIGGAKVVQNTVGLAAMFRTFGFKIEKFHEVLRSNFAKKPAIAELNVQAAQAGYDYIKNHYSGFDIDLPKLDNDDLMIIGGNDAISAGLITGGITFFSGYPMSPATSILEKMIKYAEDYGYMVIQSEDEISAMVNVIGAAHAGGRSATATSGGGMSLMVEAVGLASSAEIPVVLIDVMRPGPSTGLPTWTGQGDLLFSIYMGQDAFPRIVLTPGDVEEAYYMAAEALNLAEEFQLPVIILSDKWLGSSYFSYKPFDQSKVEIRTGKSLFFDESIDLSDDKYKRFKITDDGVSPRAIPGMDRKYIYKTTGNEHDESGKVNDTSYNRIQQMEKRMKKMEIVAQKLPKPKIYGSNIEDADIVFFTWGSNKGIILDAMELLPMKTSLVHVSYIWPFPAQFIQEAYDKSKLPILVEQTYDAQMGQLIRNFCLRDIAHKILRFDGRPLDPLDIVRIVNEIINN